MLRRLMMALLIACLAMPAMAKTAHCPPAAPLAASADHAASHQAGQHQTGQHEGHHAPASNVPVTTAAHDCIGCIAPQAPLLGLSLPDMIGTPAYVLPDHTGLPGSARGPETPPPRT